MNSVQDAQLFLFLMSVFNSACIRGPALFWITYAANAAKLDATLALCQVYNYKTNVVMFA